MHVLALAAAAILTILSAGGALIMGVLAVRRWFLDRRATGLAPVWPWMLLSAASLTGLATAPLLAASRAEARTGWVDRDGDGMLDGFTNGASDWLDVNGGAFAASWLIGITISVAVLTAGA